MNRSKSTQEKWWAFFFAIAIVGVAVITVLLVDNKDLPLTIVGALLGVSMTVFATYFLFKGQSNLQSEILEQQQKQQLECETFKQKLSSYRLFLNAFQKYVSKPDEDTKKEVIFHTMAIRMHCDDSIIEALDKNILQILKDTQGDDEIPTLIVSLNNIAYIFRSELYGSPIPAAVNNLIEFGQVIKESADVSSPEQKQEELEADAKDDEAAVASSRIMSWDDKVKDLASKGWTIKNGDDSFELSSPANPMIISVYRKKGKYVVSATKEEDSAFSQRLKDNYGGSRRYGTWWRELPISNYKVTEGTLLTQLPINDKARFSVIKWIDKLIENAPSSK